MINNHIRFLFFLVDVAIPISSTSTKKQRVPPSICNYSDAPFQCLANRNIVVLKRMYDKFIK